jgi:flagella basal body P-ring formation protein FlgA
MRSWADLSALAFCVIALAALDAIAGTGRIVVAPEVTVQAQVLRLGDIAALEGERAQALGTVVLGTAPAAGESRTLDGSFILSAIRREAGSLEGLTYTIPASVRVRRAAQEVSEAAVRQIIEEYLAQTLGAGAGDAVLRSVELPGPVRVPAGAWTARVLAPPGMALLGRVRLQVEFSLDGRPAKTVWVTTDIGLYGPVVVATRPVARGELVSAADVTVDRLDLSQVARGVATDVADVAGRLARSPLVPYSPIRREQLESPATVHRGDVVLLVVERGGMRITAPGEVRSDAGRGEQVRVLNRVSRKDVVGRVRDASTVAVEF